MKKCLVIPALTALASAGCAQMGDWMGPTFNDVKRFHVEVMDGQAALGTAVRNGLAAVAPEKKSEIEAAVDPLIAEITAMRAAADERDSSFKTLLASLGGLLTAGGIGFGAHAKGKKSGKALAAASS